MSFSYSFSSSGSRRTRYYHSRTYRTSSYGSANFNFNTLCGSRRITNYGYHSDDEEDRTFQPSKASSSKASNCSVKKIMPCRGPEQTLGDVLTVNDVDLYIAQNTKAHHTDRFDIAEDPNAKLVVRRGQKFNIKLTFSRYYNPSKDDLRLVFQFGDNPMPNKGTHVEFLVSDKDEDGEWGAKCDSQFGSSLIISIITPPDCLVGQWKFFIDVVKQDNTDINVYRYNLKDPIYVLFNPWCKDDAVYLDDKSELEEYILNETGRIYVGAANDIKGKPWVYGQFYGNVLDCALYLLDISGLKPSLRGDPILVTRKLTALVNSNEDHGVLWGKWARGDLKKYSGGKTPFFWNGSVSILEQYFEQKMPVKYGQCWVFAGVLNSVARALGIPARTITTFESGHDTDDSVTIDTYMNDDGKILHQEPPWNFHVWNEVWMSRPDLPQGYGGWQACDATPQETSDGVHCCGPCPVKAIREGEVNLPYDGKFIFAEVNADEIIWRICKDGTLKCMEFYKNVIGLNISTKACNSSRRVDVTNNYKYNEGSAAERAAVRKAVKSGSKKDIVMCDTGLKDVQFNLTFDPKQVLVGQNFGIKLMCVNTSKETRTFFGNCSAHSMYYTGVLDEELENLQLKNIMMKPGEKREVHMVLKPQDYYNKLNDCCLISVTVMIQVLETKQVFFKKETGRLRKPDLTIKAPKECRVGQEMDVCISFINPMPCTLTDCEVELEGPGLSKPRTYPQSDVAPGRTFCTTIKINPNKVGQRELVVSFNSRQLEDINDTHEVTVKV